MKTKQYFPNNLLPLLAVIMLLIVAGCEDFFISEVDMKIPGGEPKLVVNSYISPQDTVIAVYVNRSISYSTSGNQPFPGSIYPEVLMARKGEPWVQLEFNPLRGFWSIHASNIVIEAGGEYVLQVSWNNEVVSAECFVPELHYQGIEVGQPVVGTDQWGYGETRLDWKVFASTVNGPKYYSTDAYIKWSRIESYYGNTDTVSGISQMWMDRGTQWWIDDNGSAYSFRGRGGSYYYGPWGRSQDDYSSTSIDSFFVYLMQTDIHYYLFHKSVNDYDYYGDDNPFAEAVHIYTNIQGGLGVFAGYNRVNFFAGAIRHEY